jgi:hypothetical protein
MIVSVNVIIGGEIHHGRKKILDLIKILVDILVQGVSAFEKQKQKKRKNEFGTSLIHCYLSLIEIISTAKHILHRIRYDVHYYEKWEMTKEEPIPPFMLQISDLLDEQIVNIDRLMISLREIEKELQLFSPEVVESLREATSIKMWRLRRLIEVLESGSIELPALSEEWKLTNQVEIVADVREKLKLYVSEDLPYSYLINLEKSVKSMREFIVNNFNVDEILASIEKERRITIYLSSDELN